VTEQKCKYFCFHTSKLNEQIFASTFELGLDVQARGLRNKPESFALKQPNAEFYTNDHMYFEK